MALLGKKHSFFSSETEKGRVVAALKVLLVRVRDGNPHGGTGGYRGTSRWTLPSESA